MFDLKRYSARSVIGEGRIWLCNFIISYIPSHTIRNMYYKHVMDFKIDKDASILMGCRFNAKGGFVIGANSTVNQYCHMDNRGGIFIGENVSISPGVSVVTADHNVHSVNFEGRTSPVVIKDYSFIGYESLILKGVVIGRGSVVAARALVIKDCDDFSIYVGAPSVRIGSRPKESFCITKYNRLFH